MNRAEKRALKRIGRSCPYDLCGGSGEFYKNEYYGIVPCPCSMEKGDAEYQAKETDDFLWDEK